MNASAETTRATRRQRQKRRETCYRCEGRAAYYCACCGLSVCAHWRCGDAHGVLCRTCLEDD